PRLTLRGPLRGTDRPYWEARRQSLYRALAAAAGGRACAAVPGVGPVTLRCRLYVIVLGLRKNLAEMRDCASTKLESIGQHTEVSPETGATGHGVCFPVPCHALVK